MIYSPVASWVRSGLEANPDLTPRQVDKCIPLIITRIVGFLHNAVQVRALPHAHARHNCAAAAPHLQHACTMWQRPSSCTIGKRLHSRRAMCTSDCSWSRLPGRCTCR